MNVGSLNIRGLGAKVKKKKRLSYHKRGKTRFHCNTTDKDGKIEGKVCEHIWGDGDCGWVYHPAIGNAGRMLSMWKSKRGNLIFSFSGCSFLRVCMEWGCKKQRCFAINIYGPCNMAEGDANTGYFHACIGAQRRKKSDVGFVG